MFCLGDSPRAALIITVCEKINKYFFYSFSHLNFKIFEIMLIMAFSFLGNLEQLISYVGFSHWIQRFITLCALFYIRLVFNAEKYEIFF